MRGSGWLPGGIAWALWLACVAWPALALLLRVDTPDPTAGGAHAVGAVLATSAGWAAAVALGATLLGWLPGQLLGRAAGRRGFLPLAVACLAPICLPAYLVFYAWWQAWPPDSATFRWAVEHGLVPQMRLLTLYVSLVGWSWPIVAWCVAGGVSSEPPQQREMLDLQGASRAARLAAAMRRDARGLALGGFVAFVAVFNNTTCFDLAEVFTVGNELRALEAGGAGAGTILAAASPSLAMMAVAIAALWTMLARRPTLAAAGRPAASRPAAWVFTAGLWTLTVALPLGLFLARVGDPAEIARFVQWYGRGLGHTLAVAAVTGVLGAVLALGLAGHFRDRRRWVRGAGHLQALGWLAMACVPAAIAAVALEAGYNIPGTSPVAASPIAAADSGSHITMADVFYRRPVILVLGHLARLGFVAVLLGHWLARGRPGALVDAASLDGADTLRGQLAADGPRAAAAAIAALAIVAVLSVSEIAVTARLQPPGYEAIATSILNDMHYQRPRTVLVAALVFGGLAVAAAAITAGMWRAATGSARPLTLALATLLTVGLGGCGGHDGSVPGPLPATLTFGATGDSLGQFNYPRGIAVDRTRDVVYVVDKTARVQRFGFDGAAHLEWKMPEKELGKPTGLNVAEDGTVYVADTHYFRIIAYDPEGTEVLRFGGYGQAPGQFIYPTDVAFGPEGRLYVSEYGGNDRVQVFSADGEFLFEFGEFGEGEGQFRRPQSMMFSPDRSELYIADAVNHRIVVTDPEGRWLRTFGTPGRGPGELLYPYDLAMLPDGALIVCEFGNNRVQRFSATGAPDGTWGIVGAGEGELKYPWGVDVADGRVFVLDSGNNRVQVMRRPS